MGFSINDRAPVDIYDMVAERDSIMKIDRHGCARNAALAKLGGTAQRRIRSARSDCSSAATRRSPRCSISPTRTESRVFVSSSTRLAPRASSFSMKQAR